MVVIPMVVIPMVVIPMVVIPMIVIPMIVIPMIVIPVCSNADERELLFFLLVGEFGPALRTSITTKTDRLAVIFSGQFRSWFAAHHWALGVGKNNARGISG